MHKSLSTLVILMLTSGFPARGQTIIAQTGSTSVGSRSVTLVMKGTTLKQALDEIARQSGTPVAIGREALTDKRRINLYIKSVDALTAVSTVIRGTSLKVHVASTGQIMVTGADKLASTTALGIIIGKVTDAKTGKGIASANVSIGGNQIAKTDENGAYRLTGVVSGVQTVTARLLGYAKQTKTITVGEGASVVVDFKLESNANVLDQVIVTGTVVATELRAVPNAITVVTAKQIEERGITRIDQLFRGDIPGLFSLNLGSATLVDEVIMFSRGATALTAQSAGTQLGVTNPIKTYIDGVEMSDSKYLSQIDPSSIERIEILTGPQASTIYGSNAINGVMQIFTKRGGQQQAKGRLKPFEWNDAK